jgi:hypothetical protein
MEMMMPSVEFTIESNLFSMAFLARPVRGFLCLMIGGSLELCQHEKDGFGAD